MELGRYGLREILDCTIFDYKTGKPFLYTDYATAAENEWSAEQTYATGGSGNPRRIVFNDGKNSTLNLSTQIFTMKHLAMMAGRDIESKAGLNIYKREVLTVAKDELEGLQVTLSKTPISTTGAVDVTEEDIAVYQFKNGIDTEEVIIAEFDPVSKKVMLEGVEENTEVAVYYQWKTTTKAHRLTFTAKDFPKYVKIVGDTTLVDELAGEIAAGQLIYYKAKVQPNFTLSMSPTGDPTTIQMVFDLFPVKVADKDVMADITLYDEEDEE